MYGLFVANIANTWMSDRPCTVFDLFTWIICVYIFMCKCVGLLYSSDTCPVLPSLYIVLNCVLHMWFLALRLTRQEHSAPTLGDMIEKVLPGKWQPVSKTYSNTFHSCIILKKRHRMTNIETKMWNWNKKWKSVFAPSLQSLFFLKSSLWFKIILTQNRMIKSFSNG